MTAAAAHAAAAPPHLFTVCRAGRDCTGRGRYCRAWPLLPGLASLTACPRPMPDACRSTPLSAP